MKNFYFKTILFSLAIITTFILLGCTTKEPVCGNQICELNEDTPYFGDVVNNYYCPQDCGLNSIEENKDSLSDNEIINQPNEDYNGRNEVNPIKEDNSFLQKDASLTINEFNGKKIISKGKSIVGVLIPSKDETRKISVLDYSSKTTLNISEKTSLPSNKNKFIIELKEPSLSEKIINSNKKLDLKSLESEKLIIQDQQNNIIKKIEGMGHIKGRYYKTINAIAVEVEESKKEEFVKTISNDPLVSKIYPDSIVKTNLDTTIPYLGIDELFRVMHKGNGVKVGIIDTGIDYTHQDFGKCTTQQFLSGNCLKVAGGYDFVNNDNDPIDDQGHGTHVAGIVASDGNLKGVAPKATLYAIKVLDSSGSGYQSDIIKGIEWALDPNQDGNFSDKLDIINLSLGGQGNPDDPLSKSVDRAFDLGILPVVAAGNYRDYSTISSPGTARNALTVGAMNDLDGLIANFSSKGPVIKGKEIILKPEISAPGVNVCSSQYDSVWSEYHCIDNEHISLNGTSMATPHVTGVAALVKEFQKSFDSKKLKSALVNVARTPIEIDNLSYGAGIVSPIESLLPIFVFDPVTINIPTDENSKLITLENVMPNTSCIVFDNNVTFTKYTNMKKTIETKQVIIELEQNCLSFGEKANLKVTINRNDFSSGIYSGNIIGRITTYPNKVVKIPITFKNNPFKINLKRAQRMKVWIDFSVLWFYDSNGNIVYSKIIDNDETVFEIDVDKSLKEGYLTYVGVYFQEDQGKTNILNYTTSIKVDLSVREITIDENNSEEIPNNYYQFTKEKYSNDKLELIHDFSPSIPNNFTKFTVLLMGLKADFKFYALKSRNNSYYLQIDSIENPFGENNYSTKEKHLFSSKAKIEPNAINSILMDPNVKSTTTLNIWDTLKANDLYLGLSMYDNKTIFILTFLDIVSPGVKILNYHFDTTEKGLRIVHYIMKSLERGDFYQMAVIDLYNYGNIPSIINLTNPPINIGLPEINQSEASLRTLLYDNKKGSARIAYWLFDFTRPERMGKLKIISPSGKIVYDGYGFDFYVNCKSDNFYYWPKIMPCEIGEYIFESSTENLLREEEIKKARNYLKWDGSNWHFIKSEEIIPQYSLEVIPISIRSYSPYQEINYSGNIIQLPVSNTPENYQINVKIKNNGEQKIVLCENSQQSGCDVKNAVIIHYGLEKSGGYTRTIKLANSNPLPKLNPGEVFYGTIIIDDINNEGLKKINWGAHMPNKNGVGISYGTIDKIVICDVNKNWNGQKCV